MRIIGEHREGDINLTSKGSGEVTIDETYIYTVQADSKSDTRLYVAACPGLPIVGQTLSAGGLAVCKSVRGQRRQDNPLIWDFTCNFSSEVDENNDQQPGTDPETWVPVRKTIFERQEYPSFVDAEGKHYQTSAGEDFRDHMMQTRWLLSWEFTQFESASITDEQLMDRNEVVNESTYKGKSPKTLLCRVMESSLGFYYGQRRRLTKYRVTWKSNKWTDRVPDRGTYYLNGSGNKIPFVDFAGNIILGNLNGNGGKLAETNPPTDPQILEFDRYPVSDFAFLRI
jgi:hypothetical protein